MMPAEICEPSAPTQRAFFASLLADRRLALGLCGVAVVHLGSRACGIAGWPCPILTATGLPCPGCGLSRAAVELLGGHFANAMARHAFAPVAIVGIALLLAAALLGGASRARLVAWVQRVEARTHFAAWSLAALLLYWALRLALDGAHFLSLVRK